MPITTGRVITRYGKTCLLEVNGKLIECRLRRSVDQVVCGDWVEFDADDRVLIELNERQSSFARADKRGRKQLIAANIDLIVVVVAPEPAPTRDLINRYLVACHNVAIEGAIFLNKCDLIDEADSEHWQQQGQLYQSLGYPFLTGGAKSGIGLAELQALLGERVSILVGQSGVGKSSLINQLVPDLALRTQQISSSTGKGRHTTTATTLYPMASGGAIIDSPGVWEYGIWTMDNADVAAGFIEFADHIGRCRFANCSHTEEPGCAVDLAAQSGEICPQRLASYRRIVNTSTRRR